MATQLKNPTVSDAIAAGWTDGENIVGAIDNVAAYWIVDSAGDVPIPTVTCETFNFNIPSGSTITNMKVVINCCVNDPSANIGVGTIFINMPGGSVKTGIMSVNPDSTLGLVTLEGDDAYWGLTLDSDVFTNLTLELSGEVTDATGVGDEKFTVDGLYVEVTYTPPRTFYKTSSIYRCGNSVRGK